MEHAIEQLQHFLFLLDKTPLLLLTLVAFCATLIENLFPPAPSDVIFVAIAIIVGRTEQSIIPIILAGTFGATTGFFIMYQLGKKFEKKIIETNRIKFISKQSIQKVEHLFQKWGMKLVVINRFMSGTRAVISFFAGMSALDKQKVTIYAATSSFLFYGLLAAAGYYFGKDWKTLVEYLQIYEKIALSIGGAIIIIPLIIWTINKFILKKNNNKLN